MRVSREGLAPLAIALLLSLDATNMCHGRQRKHFRSTRTFGNTWKGDYTMPRFPIAIRINWSPLAGEIIKDRSPWIPPTGRRLPGGTQAFLLDSPESLLCPYQQPED